jgi:hypothetical protein
MFDARFWKFADGSPDLSNGATPPLGAWPAYVSAVVFARNIRVTTTAATPQPLTALPALALQPQAVQMLQAQRLATIAAPVTATPAVSAFVARPAFAAATPVRPIATAPVAATAFRPIAATPVANPMVRLNTAMTYRAPTPMPVGAPVAPPSTMPRPPVQPIPIAVPPRPVGIPSPPAPPPPAQPQPLPDNTISILAFICRPLRKVPNPDPALDWSDP